MIVMEKVKSKQTICPIKLQPLMRMTIKQLKMLEFQRYQTKNYRSNLNKTMIRLRRVFNQDSIQVKISQMINSQLSNIKDQLIFLKLRDTDRLLSY